MNQLSSPSRRTHWPLLVSQPPLSVRNEDAPDEMLPVSAGPFVDTGIAPSNECINQCRALITCDLSQCLFTSNDMVGRQ